MHPIDLAKPRIVAINDRGHNYTLTLAPITRKQWLKYFSSTVSISENQNGNTVSSFDSSGARLELVNEVLIDASGYKTGSGCAVTELNGWKSLIPSAHRLAAGSILISAERVQTPDDEPILLGFEAVKMDALWSWNGKDAMAKVTGLKHIFGAPTVEQQRRYNRDMSRSQVIGGSRTGKTRWLGAQATLVELYDELITAVEGYAVNGAELVDNNEIVERMDTYHKVVAAEALFTPATPAIEEADGE
jgi:hypothetical protein